ncbi:PREDICTED: carcinoembryonic antigen-related cell adhesion molecule 16-like [Gekko japonicus]|uniref:Carcinoembryonic antigen-related cell adhesion molecule 16-like n=1 Tax=Gekko japonicus TaxID=146911 RepID=A0ABM1KUD6_GEKJA|nr:PREDICTED: carcinoembryonic antigen-related cell adhesion molecule 16-like [Gekko japonicus]
MIELPKACWASPKAFVLAGILLSCAFSLGVAERKVSLILEPPRPQVGQNVTIAVRGGPQRFALCEWSREPRNGEPEAILEYIPGSSPQERKGSGHSGRETVRADCSLHIANLRPSDTGNYSIIFEESDQRPGQQPDEFYVGSVHLEVSVNFSVVRTGLWFAEFGPPKKVSPTNLTNLYGKDRA